jgi:hypothetical protein
MSHGEHITKAKKKKKRGGSLGKFHNVRRRQERDMDIKNSQDYPKTTEPNVDGYLTGMARCISFFFVPKKNLVQ